MKQNKETIKSYFETGDQPTQEQYQDTWDSFWHKDESMSATSLITTSGRITLRTNFSWVTNADDNYSFNLYTASDECGSGDDPIYSWTQLGHCIPSGYRIKQVMVIGKANALDVDDVRFRFVKRIKNTPQDWQDVNSELDFTNTVLYDDLWMQNTKQDTYTGMSSRKAKRNFIMDTVDDKNLFNEDGEFFMYLKPSGSFTVDRYFQYTLSIEIEKA